jgi:hypothetical protein
VVLVLATACASPATAKRDAATNADWSDPRAAICSTTSDDGSSAVAFSVVQQIFGAECRSCHSVGAVLDLSPDVAWTNLVNHTETAETCGGILVVPGDPDASYLYQKLSSNAPCTGERMPRGEFGPDPLPDCVVALVRDWIAAGASDH